MKKDDNARRIEDLLCQYLATLTLVKVRMDALQSFVLYTLESRMRVRGERGSSLETELLEFQAEQVNRALATIADDQPDLATEMKRILEERPSPPDTPKPRT